MRSTDRSHATTRVLVGVHGSGGSEMLSRSSAAGVCPGPIG
jgi:hypothetical protein